MTAPAAPERRKGPLGSSQVRVRDEWLDEDAPGTMAAWAEWQAESRHQASQARQEVTRKPSPKAEAKLPPDLEALERRPGPKGSTQVRIGDVWISERTVMVWGAFGRLRGVPAVAEELGMTRNAVRNALSAYETRMGVERPTEAREAQDASEPVVGSGSDHASDIPPAMPGDHSPTTNEGPSRPSSEPEPAGGDGPPAGDPASGPETQKPADLIGASATPPRCAECDEPVTSRGSGRIGRCGNLPGRCWEEPVADGAHIVGTDGHAPAHGRGECICPDDARYDPGCPAHASDRVQGAPRKHDHQWGAWADEERGIAACIVDGCGPQRDERPLDLALPPLADAGVDHASDLHPKPVGWRHDAKADAYLIVSFDATIPVVDLIDWPKERRDQLLWAIELLRDALGQVGS